MPAWAICTVELIQDPLPPEEETEEEKEQRWNNPVNSKVRFLESMACRTRDNPSRAYQLNYRVQLDRYCHL